MEESVFFHFIYFPLNMHLSRAPTFHFPLITSLFSGKNTHYQPFLMEINRLWILVPTIHNCKRSSLKFLFFLTLVSFHVLSNDDFTVVLLSFRQIFYCQTQKKYFSFYLNWSLFRFSAFIALEFIKSTLWKIFFHIYICCFSMSMSKYVCYAFQ